jgi:hypothetical protein
MTMQVKCNNPEECSNTPVTVFITHMNYDLLSPYHFDLSGTAFGALARLGLEQKLRERGIIDTQFRRSLLLAAFDHLFYSIFYIKIIYFVMICFYY